jgi:hypothetical protein
MGIEIYYNASKFVDIDRLMKVIPKDGSIDGDSPHHYHCHPEPPELRSREATEQA